VISNVMTWAESDLIKTEKIDEMQDQEEDEIE